MAKPKLYYEVRQTVSRTTGQPVFWPAIIDRDQSITLEDVIKNAIDRGVIAGLKVWRTSSRTQSTEASSPVSRSPQPSRLRTPCASRCTRSSRALAA